MKHAQDMVECDQAQQETILSQPEGQDSDEMVSVDAPCETVVCAPRYYKRYHFLVKLVLFLLPILLAIIALMSAMGIWLCLEYGFYGKTEDAVKEELFIDWCNHYALDALLRANTAQSEDALEEYAESHFVNMAILDQDGTLLWGNLDPNTQYEWVISVTHDFAWDMAAQRHQDTTYYLQDALSHHVTVQFAFTTSEPWAGNFSDELGLINSVVEHGYRNRYTTIANLLLSVVFWVVSVYFLFAFVGHTPRGGHLVRMGWAKCPIELAFLGWATVFFFCVDNVDCCLPINFSNWENVLVLVLLILGGVVSTMLWLLYLAVQWKLGYWWKQTLVYRLGSVCWRMLCRVCRPVAQFTVVLWENMPLIWRGVLAPVGVLFFDLLVFWCCFVIFYDAFLFVLLLVVQGVLLLGWYLYQLLAQSILYEGGKALAEGNDDYQLNTKYLRFAYKAHAEHLNQISQGLTRAVNQRLQSERMKTELITNVSHDIKTPLTSIINYADLLSKEETDNEKIVEYTAVISRQSDRLKRLIVDLVEASKASTGNVEVNLAPCEVGVLVSQVAAEYEKRFAERLLALVVKQPELPLWVMADGRHLWRVFDNLMNNIIKYAQEGTRVYLHLEQQGNRMLITLKNISAYPLDITAAELMERFVRGDASRHNEGNGLGLSIAQSLIELQGGTLTLHVDGDLFKVEIGMALTNSLS